MRGFLTVFEMLVWGLAIWLFIGLIGTLRWFAPGADAGPDAYLAVAIKVLALAAFVGGWALTARRGDGSRPNHVEALQVR